MRRFARSVCFASLLGIVLFAAPQAGAQTFTPDRADEAAARKEGALSWYTSTPVALAQQLADKFQHDTGIKVQLLRTGGQAVLRRLQQEVAAGRPGADVMTMSDAGAANGLVKQGLFVAFRPDGFDKVVSVAKDKDGSLDRAAAVNCRHSRPVRQGGRSRTCRRPGRTSSSRNTRASW